MSEGGFLEQLKQRRVIRAAVIYVALVWVALQAADLLAGAGMIGDTTVRWLILVGVVGFPITLLASWFLDSPWRQRRWASIAGDLTVIVAISVAAILFAWQQWFTSFTRPVVAVLKIEATDTRSDTEDLAHHLGERFRAVLATRAELRVIELGSSQSPSIANLSIDQKANALGADFLISGTMGQSNTGLRLTLQLFAGDGELIWGETFEDRVADQAQLQNRVLAELYARLPLPKEAITESRDLVASCRYPADRDAIFAMALAGNRGSDASLLTPFIERDDDAGMLQLASARFQFNSIDSLPPPQRPVAQSIAMQHLADAETKCPELSEIELLRLRHTLQLQQGEIDEDELRRRHPNSAFLYLELAKRHSKLAQADVALALAQEALLLDPANGDILCQYPGLSRPTFPLPDCN